EHVREQVAEPARAPAAALELEDRVEPPDRLPLASRRDAQLRVGEVRHARDLDPPRLLGESIPRERTSSPRCPPPSVKLGRGDNTDDNLVPVLERQQRPPGGDAADVAHRRVDRIDDPAPPALPRSRIAVLLADDGIS